jgi:hypothetical protein
MEAQHDAAARIQAHFRGGRQRDVNARHAQAHAPYRNLMHYKMATHAYSGEAAEAAVDRDADASDEWLMYLSAMAAPTGQVAFLHSFQREGDLEGAKQWLYNGNPPVGSIYSPPDDVHDMRTNSAWMLGLAHNAMPAMLTTTLDGSSIVRNSAWENKPPEECTTERNLSALAREVVGMTGSGHYAVGEWMHGRQMLRPTASAARAALADFRTPSGMPYAELKGKLDEAGVDTSRLHVRPLRKGGR